VDGHLVDVEIFLKIVLPAHPQLSLNHTTSGPATRQWSASLANIPLTAAVPLTGHLGSRSQQLHDRLSSSGFRK
jgi:hypothetical protein